MLSLNGRCMIVSVANSKRDEAQYESDKHDRDCAAEVSLTHNFHQKMVWLDVETLSHTKHCGKNWVGEDYHQENYEVDGTDTKEKKTFACLAVIKLTETRNDGKHGRNAWIAWWL